jgi:hypothetical protein
MTQMGHQDLFPPLKLSAGYEFRKETIDGVHHKGPDAPIVAIQQRAIDAANYLT